MSTTSRIIIAISPTRNGRFAVYHEPACSTDPTLNIKRTLSTKGEAEHYADGVVAGLRACGRMTSVPHHRNTIRE